MAVLLLVVDIEVASISCVLRNNTVELAGWETERLDSGIEVGVANSEYLEESNDDHFEYLDKSDDDHSEFENGCVGTVVASARLAVVVCIVMDPATADSLGKLFVGIANSEDLDESDDDHSESENGCEENVVATARLVRDVWDVMDPSTVDSLEKLLVGIANSEYLDDSVDDHSKPEPENVCIVASARLAEDIWDVMGPSRADSLARKLSAAGEKTGEEESKDI